ncbi:hypothetical protein C8A00DRAFT_14089 [Chaetomidium leptoderma]|uniref:Uncharacterized protein n=1 Tax=Chaetomidium leptoderma TaxID=669021 RepID=A0AAN6VQZ3_9PEZI|nr:hypothetical protein C8A00DRAFT_14089 [Chaetomidium leptoderma]
MSTKPPVQPTKIDKEFERKVAQKTIQARPDEVTSESSVRHVVEESQAPPDSNPDVMVALKGDLNTVKDTFALATVPREVYALGLAGTLPYLATSVSTVFLSWNLNTELPTQSNFINGFLFSHDSALHWLRILEPIQVGYGALIISFLGAIHWGLEFAEKLPAHDRTRFRYGIGVLAPAMAWPTILLPIEWALTTQFAAFCALYLADSRATVKGWAPPWYGTYRFVLTAVVGTAILVSLIGRAKVGEGRPEDLTDRIRASPSSGDKHRNWAKEEAEEREKLRKEKKKKEAEKKAKEEQAKKAPADSKGRAKPGEQIEGDKGEAKKESSADSGEKEEAKKDGGAKSEDNENSGDKKSERDGDH